MKNSEIEAMAKSEEKNWWFIWQRLIIKNIIEKIIDKNEKTIIILDDGCGTGENLKLLAHYGKAQGVDISGLAVSFCRNKGFTDVKKINAASLPFEDQKFHLILLSHVLEHVKSDLQVLKEAKRVLKKGGRILILSPAFSLLWSRHDELLKHLRRYKYSDIKNLALKLNLKIEFFSYYFAILFLPILIFSLKDKYISTSKAKSIIEPPNFINNFLIFLGRIESALIKIGLNMPFGTSFVTVLKK